MQNSIANFFPRGWPNMGEKGWESAWEGAWESPWESAVFDRLCGVAEKA